MFTFIAIYSSRFTPEFICYDDGCHLRKYAQHSTRRDATPTAQKMAQIEIVVDKLHMEGHTDKWCMANCDPHLFNALDKVSPCSWYTYRCIREYHCKHSDFYRYKIAFTHCIIQYSTRLTLRHVNSVSRGFPTTLE